MDINTLRTHLPDWMTISEAHDLAAPVLGITHTMDIHPSQEPLIEGHLAKYIAVNIIRRVAGGYPVDPPAGHVHVQIQGPTVEWADVEGSQVEGGRGLRRVTTTWRQSPYLSDSEMRARCG